MIRMPVVLMIRHPPAYVPSPIAVAADAITHTGTCTWAALIEPCATSASVMIPMVFCPSLVPCDSDSSPLDRI